jgi:hypothetical protein
MSNLSPKQFHTLYRGLSFTTDVKKPLGMHWTGDPERAVGFARNPIRRGPGVVIEGQVAKKSRVTKLSDKRDRTRTYNPPRKWKA